MALQDDVTKFLSDLDAFIAAPSWLGAVSLTADGAAIIKDIAGGGAPKASPVGGAGVKAACARAVTLGTGLNALRTALAAELGKGAINWQNVLAIMLAVLQALGPILIKG